MASFGEKIVASNKNGFDAGCRLAQTMFDSIEKFALLNAEAAKVLIQEGLANLQSLAGSKDFAVSGFTAGWRPMEATERFSGYSRNAYQIVAEAGNKVSEIVEQRLLQSGQELEEWVEEAMMASPFGQSEAAVSAAKTALTSARTVIEQISRAAREATDYADASVKATAAATAEAAKGVAR